MSYFSAGEAARDLHKLAHLCADHNHIAPELYDKYHVKRGLREENGRGVLTGLTEISTVNGSREEEGQVRPIQGELFYRGIPIQDLTEGFVQEKRFGFEETVYLLLFGVLPDEKELAHFTHLLSYSRKLPNDFIEDVLLKSPNRDIMNSMTQAVLALNAYDRHSEDLDLPNVLRQCVELIAILPLIAVYSYLSYRHYILGRGLYLHNPKPELSTAENILRLLRQDKHDFTMEEARLLDLALVLHAEHGGGNNSTFTTHVVTSAGTDTYSSMAASLCSLKGIRHGGANLKVRKMFRDIMEHVEDWNDDEEIARYLTKILRKEAFDRTGLIYGIGHAVYTLSDPRAEILKKYTMLLAKKASRTREASLYLSVARIAPELMKKERHLYTPVSPNVDFYSGFAYNMLNIPDELFTPLFAVSRIAGWSAHRIEELTGREKIIRPAYLSVSQPEKYVPLAERKPSLS